ncbi:hypothetical protein FQA39_LY06541 [Lamprigera yunnana]|nr:hypothetical protein FQA39_LY06541 [Lamprigera yunnana]
MISSTVQTLLTPVSQTYDYDRKHSTKVSIFGAGTIGAAIAFSLLVQNVAEDLVLVDQDEDLVRGELLDLEQASALMEHSKVCGGRNYTISDNSQICIITVGAGGDNDRQTLIRNTNIFKDVIPKVAMHNPDSILLIVTDPVDVLSFVAWKLSNFPPNRVIGYGNILQTAKFKHLLSQKFKVSPSSMHAFVIGEQGPKSVPVWSGVSISGVHLKDVNSRLGTEEDPENWLDIHKEVLKRQTEVERLKSCESWSLAVSVTKLAKAILHDTKECFSVSTHLKGFRQGVNNDVFLSLPCIIGNEGVFTIVKQMLSEEEQELLQESVDYMSGLQKDLNLQ